MISTRVRGLAACDWSPRSQLSRSPPSGSTGRGGGQEAHLGSSVGLVGNFVDGSHVDVAGGAKTSEKSVP